MRKWKTEAKNGNLLSQKNGKSKKKTEISGSKKTEKKQKTITPGCRVAYPATKKSWETIRFLAMFEKTGSFLDHFSLLY